MKKVNDFFSMRNTIKDLSEDEINQLTHNYIDPLKAFARTTYKSIYIIDYQKKGFEFVSDNPLFLCGHTADEVREMGYEFYLKYVVKEDLDLLLKINQVGFDFYETIPVEERLLYTISYDFSMKNQEGKIFLINQKLTPMFLNNEGKIWKALCIISLSNEHSSGNVQIFKTGDTKVLKYNLDGDYWSTSEKIILSERETEILHYSIKGYTIQEIAETIFVSPDTVKFHRKKLFTKLEVNNIAEAISYVTNNKLI